MSRQRAQKRTEPTGAGPLAWGFSTKIHLKAAQDGDSLGFCLSDGQANDSPHFEALLDLGPDITPQAAVGDKSYDSMANR
jgi:hypothetical protein